MSGWISLLNGLAVSLFGSILSASFCGALDTKRNRHIFTGCMAALPLAQGLLGLVWPTEFLRQIYPLLVHLPLTLILILLTGKRLLPVVSVLTAYLCCQLRRWLSLLFTAMLGGGAMMQDVFELAVTLPLLVLLLHFAAPAVRRLAGCSAKEQLQFGVIPALYYVFDYVAVVYTDLLFSGSVVVLEFMPFVCCLSYLVFSLYVAAGEQERNRLEQVQKSLDLQISQSLREIQILQESQELARQYRHDLRHHLQYLSACLDDGQTEQAQTYIFSICKEIEAQKVERYCENETVNLILSAFVGRAKKEGVGMHVQACLPAFLPVSNSDLCVVLSNALENALHACQTQTAQGKRCIIDVQMYRREDKLFLQVVNPCGENIHFEDGVPVSHRPGHGIGVQSICTIVKRYGGLSSFQVRDGQFILRLSI